MAEMGSDILDILRQKAELILSGKATAGGDQLPQDVNGLFHQLQVYQIELEMQVDELRTAAEALEIQKNRFGLLFELAPVSYLVVNRKGIISNINETGVALLGIGGKSMGLNKPIAAFIDPADVDVFYLFLNGLFLSNERRSCLLNFINKSHKVICVQVSGVILRENNQEPACYLTLTDITELQQAELKLNSAKRKLEIALDAAMTGIWEVDIHNGHIFLDDFCQSIFEFKPFDFDNRIETLLDRIHPADRQLFESGLRSAIVGNKQFVLEFRVQTNGVSHVKYIQARAGMAESEQFIGTMTDLTEKRELEEESKRLKKKQEQMIRAASVQAEEKEKRRISEALHDGIAQQLYAMKLSLGLFKNPMDDACRQFNELLNNAITDLRNIAFELTPAILVEFGLNDTLTEMANRLSAQNLEVSLNLSQNLKDLDIDLQFCIYRIVQELVNNSIRHGKARYISIDIKQNKDTIVLSVTDNGAGFEVKNRGKQSSGVGLASIHNRLKLYDGTFDIKSKINKGTSVTIILKQFG